MTDEKFTKEIKRFIRDRNAKYKHDLYYVADANNKVIHCVNCGTVIVVAPALTEDGEHVVYQLVKGFGFEKSCYPNKENGLSIYFSKPIK